MTKSTPLLKERSRLSKKRLLLSAAIPLLLLGAFLVSSRLTRTEVSFIGTKAITFIEDYDGPQKKITVTNQTEVGQLLRTIRLVPKRPCACAHIHRVIFHKSGGTLEVSICDHCFAVEIPTKRRNSHRTVEYEMPPEFYAAFRTLALRRSNENWMVSP